MAVRIAVGMDRVDRRRLAALLVASPRRSLGERRRVVIVKTRIKCQTARIIPTTILPSSISATPPVSSVAVVPIAVLAPARMFAPPSLLWIVLWIHEIESAALRGTNGLFISLNGEAHL